MDYFTPKLALKKPAKANIFNRLVKYSYDKVNTNPSLHLCLQGPGCLLLIKARQNDNDSPLSDIFLSIQLHKLLECSSGGGCNARILQHWSYTDFCAALTTIGNHYGGTTKPARFFSYVPSHQLKRT
ncbi:hypothetical protein BC941DRAFT_499429 [Chlamydoabsidia padenii]|nr:hypothetical protein BC941DRAFT_499429 [Chlamydoabsidia padenii]